jgi:hypothetical protein
LSFPNFRRSFGVFLFFLALSGLSFLRRSVGAFLYFPWSIIDYIMPLRFPLPAPNRRRRSLFFLIGFLPQKTIRLQTPSTSLFLLSHWVPTRNRQSGSKHRRRRSLFFLIGLLPATDNPITNTVDVALSLFLLSGFNPSKTTVLHYRTRLTSLSLFFLSGFNPAQTIRFTNTVDVSISSFSLVDSI